MLKLVLVASLLLFSIGVSAQELNCEVVVNADRLPDGNRQIFKTLETSLNEFINQTNWTDKTFKSQERIECSMIFTILKEDGDAFQGTLQVQSSRPVYNSIYTTPLFNYQDNSSNFSYTEFEPLRFDKNTYQSDLVSLVSYYVYLILAIDSDSFKLNGGENYYKTCQRITNQVENPNSKKGWESDTSKMNRYNMLKEVLARGNKKYRKALYTYHLEGLDKMESNKKEAKNTVLDAIMSLKKVYSNNMTSFVLRMFMDAKADEIVDIFSDGPNVDTRELVSTLNKISATNATKWAKIK